MKLIKYIPIFILLFGVVIVSAKKSDYSFPLFGRLIVVDVGHGGVDPGTVYGDVYEKDINLDISLFLEEELAKLGASVLLTREGDYDLSSPNASLRKRSDFDNRINLINDSGANYYVSIHINYLEDSRYSGIQVFYLDDSSDAEIIQDTLNEYLDGDREAKKMGNYYMYEKLNVEGLLIECGFMSNEEERNLLMTSDYQKKIANAIANSLLEIL